MSNKQIVRVIEYKVKDGDTLESIAKSAGISLKELVKFNFGTTDLGL
jgi:LysM repeat protein